MGYVQGLYASQKPSNTDASMTLQICKENKQLKICGRVEEVMCSDGVDGFTMAKTMQREKEKQDTLDRKMRKGQNEFARDAVKLLKKK